MHLKGVEGTGACLMRPADPDEAGRVRIERAANEREGKGKGRLRVDELIKQVVWGNLDWQYLQDPVLPRQLRRRAAEEIVALSK